MLGVVGSKVWPVSNFALQLPTTRTQHVTPNSVASVCLGLYLAEISANSDRPSARGERANEQRSCGNARAASFSLCPFHSPLGLSTQLRRAMPEANFKDTWYLTTKSSRDLHVLRWLLGNGNSVSTRGRKYSLFNLVLLCEIHWHSSKLRFFRFILAIQQKSCKQMSPRKMDLSISSIK